MRRQLTFLAIVAAIFAQATLTSSAQPAPPPSSGPVGDDMPLTDYLGLLAQISPAAQDGAQAYLQAFQLRCRRPMKTSELRRAISGGDGDPVLMGMIRASHLRDATGLAQLGQRVMCDQGAGR
ncbi:MAG: hypothetical protein ACKVOX_07690 [Rhizobacter sp.]